MVMEQKLVLASLWPRSSINIHQCPSRVAVPFSTRTQLWPPQRARPLLSRSMLHLLGGAKNGDYHEFIMEIQWD
jgi:hypothetical protein